MEKMLKVDNDFTPCAVTIGDELFPNGIFEFNITKIFEYIKKNSDSITLEEVEVSDFFKGFSSINESHMDSVEISMPVILAEISPGQYNLIDGNHRMEKARRMGIKSVLAYRLNVEQHMRFLTNKKAYVTYIEYWNSKLKK
ncbi:MAG: ParB N-terminal domain-containing protein [Deltaproteobacteria bacterium]|nr:ParB N-terminal domain-containing protein [Deltaproteobacteria bacterium]MBW2663796.1 ParB N-terminal domain-containing protein [Deltaproteobacteria bacterium]